MKNELIDFKVFDTNDLIGIVTAAECLTEIISKHEGYKSPGFMYEYFEDWRVLVHLKHEAFNELKARYKSDRL